MQEMQYYYVVDQSGSIRVTPRLRRSANQQTARCQFKSLEIRRLNNMATRYDICQPRFPRRLLRDGGSFSTFVITRIMFGRDKNSTSSCQKRQSTIPQKRMLSTVRGKKGATCSQTASELTARSYAACVSSHMTAKLQNPKIHVPLITTTGFQKTII